MTNYNNTTTDNMFYGSNAGITSSDPFITVFATRDPTTSDINYPIQKRWWNTTLQNEWILIGFQVVQEVKTAIWQEISSYLGAVQRLQTDDGLYETPAGDPPTIIIHGVNGIVTSQGTLHQVNIGPANQLLETLTGDDGVAVAPDGTGTIKVHGNVVTNATHAKAVFTESPGVNTENIDVQVSAAIAATDITKVGLAAFKDTQFNVDANGFVSLKGGSGPPIETITGDDAVAVSPDSSGNIGLQGLVVANGTHAKAVFTESPSVHLEKIDVQVAAAIASTDITKVGLAAFKNTEFSVDGNGFVTLVGGTGVVEVKSQVFTSSGTYTPTSGMVYCIVECVGGGGGGGSTGATAGGECAAGAGGAGGGYCRKIFDAATIGVSQTVTIGAAGTAGTAGGGGGAGGTTTFGALLTSTGGNGGNGCPSGTANIIGTGVAGSGSSGDVNTGGGIGTAGLSYTPFANGGAGGGTFFGGGGNFSTTNGTAVTGVTATSYGGGGGGAAAGASQGATNGGAGAKGVVIVTEFIN